MADKSKSYGFAWLFAGLGAGALAGIVYAPQRGRQTREDNADGFREDTDSLRAHTLQAAEEVTALVEQSKRQMAALVDQSRQQVSEYVDRSR
ncbi:MAG TPA: YtxH domain-containing protein, partial [Acidobacteriaceae bacterium]|nr:YtxH domain-containing protein [Acidobacteriaceae bacterium]